MAQVDDYDIPASSEDELDDLDLGSSGNDGEGIDEDSAIFGSAGMSKHVAKRYGAYNGPCTWPLPASDTF